MYHKVKNTLLAASFMVVALVAGALLGEPLDRVRPAPAQAVPAIEPDAAAAIRLARITLDLVERGLVAEAQAAAASVAVPAAIDVEPADRRDANARKRRELGMPYFSFGTLMPRRGES